MLWPPSRRSWVVCSAAHQALVEAHCAPYTHQPITYVIEPVARNTAAAIACAAAHPETGYGYLEMGALLGVDQVYKVARFTEKPSLARAQAMLASGN